MPSSIVSSWAINCQAPTLPQPLLALCGWSNRSTSPPYLCRIQHNTRLTIAILDSVHLSAHLIRSHQPIHPLHSSAHPFNITTAHSQTARPLAFFDLRDIVNPQIYSPPHLVAFSRSSTRPCACLLAVPVPSVLSEPVEIHLCCSTATFLNVL